MSKVSVVLVVAVTMGFAVSCARKASQDDLNKVCAHKMSLQQAGQPESAATDPIAAVAEKFQRQAQEADTAKQDELARLDEECAAAAETLASDEDKAKATADCEAKRNALLAEFAKQAQQLASDKETAIAEATEAKALADKAATEKAANELMACVDLLVKARTSAAKADCQIKAATLEAFGQCK